MSTPKLSERLRALASTIQTVELIQPLREMAASAAALEAPTNVVPAEGMTDRLYDKIKLATGYGSQVKASDFAKELLEEFTEIVKGDPHGTAKMFAEAGLGNAAPEVDALKVDSTTLIGDVKERWRQLRERGEDGPHALTEDPWRSFYGGWIEGRADLLKFLRSRLLSGPSGSGEVKPVKG